MEAQMPAMAVEIDLMSDTALPAGYDWARIGEGDAGDAWAEALAFGYELPLGLARLFSPSVLGADPAPDAQIQFFAVLRDGRQVATSMLFLADGLAGIYCVSTRAEERHRGLGAHATAEALRVARRLGYRVGVLQSSTAGYGVYVRLGFGTYAQVPMFIHLPGGGETHDQ
jgi:GNAT superfamily N-acetyltransferase